MQYLMKNLYKFKNQIASIDEICQTNILLAELANHYLKKMCPSLVKNLVQELKTQYEGEYLNKDEDKLHSIRQVLNLIKREQVTNIDELCMDLAVDLNNYYEGDDRVQYIKCRKHKPYYLQCHKCDQFVSNHTAGLKSHKAKCSIKRKSLKKIKKVDTERMYKQRQNLLNEIGEVKIEEPEERITKRQMMEQKRERKLQEDKRRRQSRIVELKRINDRRMNLSKTSKGELYCQEDDDKLAKKYKEEQLAEQEEENHKLCLLNGKYWQC